ncbi:MAG: DNA-binding MarR family transcriptional regulator [Myxococcota bacterium]|jgi:DNA-binding MarR family transcriptional regulator
MPGDSPEETDDAPIIGAIETLKAESTLQLLFRAARLANAHALSSAPQPKFATPLRAAHLALFAHIPWAGARISVIAAQAGVTKQAVSQLILELEEAGVVSRRPDPADGRARIVAFTDQGLGAILGGLKHLQAVEASLESQLGGGALSQLRTGLAAIVALLEQGNG